MSTQSDKFAVARGNLMLPHPRGEEASIAEAMWNIDQGLDRFEVPDDFNEDAARQLVELRTMMAGRDGLADPAGEGLYMVLARTWDEDQRHRFSHLVDELAWFFSEYDHEHA